MAQTPVVSSSTALQGQIIDPKTGALTWSGTQWFRSIQQSVNNGLDQQGNFIGNIGPDATISAESVIQGRTEGIGTTVQNIDANGIILGPGIDFARPYLNKTTDNIGDGSGHPLAGGKAANQALVVAPPAAVTHKWINAFDIATNEFTQTQPDYSDLTNLPVLPSSASATPHQWLNSYTAATGAFTESQPAFSDISGSIAPSQIPAPTASTLGGVEAAGPVAHQWINEIDTLGVPHLSQPAFTDVSGQITTAQLPASGFSGTVTLAKLTTSGANGSLTVTNGIITAVTNPT